MAKAVIMPRFGMSQEEATIVRWLVQEGEMVSVDDPLAEVTTDKVNMEVPAPAAGILGGIRHAEGDTVPVTRVIAYILEEGESAPDHDPEPEANLAEPDSQGTAPDRVHGRQVSPVARRLAQASGIPLGAVQPSGTDGRITRRDVEAYLQSSAAKPSSEANLRPRATPAARRAAHERGVNLSILAGSGPHGRVQEHDVLRHAGMMQSGSVPAPIGRGKFIPLKGRRKMIAERMQTSAQQAPHITFDVHSDMTRALAFRENANQRAPEGVKVSMTALLIKLLACALERHPIMNAQMRPEGILLMPEINIGFAAAADEGLIVPVIPRANERSLLEIAAQVTDFTQRARSGRLIPDDVAGGTFTLSNLGMFGIDRFTAILNPPQVGILAVGQTRMQFVPDAAGAPVARPRMTLTLSADHRAVDGVQSARFLADLQQILEDPASIII